MESTEKLEKENRNHQQFHYAEITIVIFWFWYRSSWFCWAHIYLSILNQNLNHAFFFLAWHFIMHVSLYLEILPNDLNAVNITSVACSITGLIIF